MEPLFDFGGEKAEKLSFDVDLLTSFSTIVTDLIKVFDFVDIILNGEVDVSILSYYIYIIL